MTAYVLISGTLYKAPEQRVSKNSKTFATATLKCGYGDDCTFWRITAFAESAMSALLELSDGDALSAAGTMKAELYTPPGKEPRVSLSLIASSVISAKAAKNEAARERRAASKPPGQPADRGTRQGRQRTLAEMAANGGGPDYFKDSMPF